MQTFKSFLFVLAIVFSISGCGLLCKQKQTQPVTYGTGMRILYDKEFTQYQFDSICLADTIPGNLDMWRKLKSVDYETNKPIEEYLYIKRLGANEEMFRMMMVNDSTYNILKRITYADKEE